MSRARLGTLIRVVGSLLFLGLLFTQIDFSALAATLAAADSLALVGSAVTLVVIRVLMGMRLWTVARCFQMHPSWHTCFAMILSSSLAAFVLPGGVATDVVRGVQLSRLFNSPGAAFSAVVLDRFFGIVAILLIACIGWRYVPPGLPNYVGWILGAMLAGAIFASVFGTALVQILPSGWPFVAKAKEMSLAIAREAAFSRQYVYLLLLSIVIQILRCVVYVFLFVAFDVPVEPALAFVVVPIIFIIIMAPISIGGLGVREGLLVLLLVPLGASVEELALVGFASHLIELVTVLPGSWYFWKGLPEQRSAEVTAR